MAASLRFALMGLGNVGGIEAYTAVKPGYTNRIEIHGEKGSTKLGPSGISPRLSAKIGIPW